MRRRLVIVAIFLLAGAVVNVAVAWGCATQASEQHARILTVLSYHTAWRDADIRTGYGTRLRYRRDTQSGSSRVLHDDAGWPMVSLRRDWEFVERNGLFTVNLLGALQAADSPRWRALPIIPLLPGFTTNALLYAAILWLLIPGPFALGRALRSRRGKCPKCAYPMGTSDVCTECGAKLPTRVGLAT